MSHGTWESDLESLPSLPYRTVTFYGWPFQAIRLDGRLVTLPPGRTPTRSDPATPAAQRMRAYMPPVWALPVSLAATQGIAFAFFSSGY